MTSIEDAKDEMIRRCDELSKRARALRDEGLPFSFVTDPGTVGVGVLVPVARVTMP